MLTPIFITGFIMPRFYCPPPLPLNGSFELPQAAAHHAARVLRLREGDQVLLFDGLGNERSGYISTLSAKHVLISNITANAINRESPLRIVLAQAMSGSEKMDWIVQKATELGVCEIQPVNTERSVARLPQDRTAKRLEHWQQVAISACEQCGRNVLPLLHVPLDLMSWLQQFSNDHNMAAKFILLPEGSASVHALSQPQGKVILLIGPEGGFSKMESAAAQRCGFEPIRLGSRILRTETAAIAGLSVLQTLWGDF